jgi:hypothetical protein
MILLIIIRIKLKKNFFAENIDNILIKNILNLLFIYLYIYILIKITIWINF